MKSLAMRIRKLEGRLVPAESEETRRLCARLESARRRMEEHEQEARAHGERPRLLIPLARKGKTPFKCDQMIARLELGRELAWRESLVGRYRATFAEISRAATEQERASAQTHYVELGCKCQTLGFASIEAFMRNCQAEGWLNGDSQ
jgi:hypothetical protein